MAMRYCFGALRRYETAARLPSAVSAIPSIFPSSNSARSYVTPTTPLHFKKRLFKSFFRLKRKHPTDVPSDPTKVTLFHQDPLPDDLRLPKPAEPLLRLGAGLFDAAASVVAGAAAGGLAYAAVGATDMQTVVAAAQGIALSTWVFRDSFADGGNRSFGKKIFKLELAYWDGTLPTRAHSILRNWYFAALPFMAMHPLANIVGTMFFVFDGASVFFTQDARKLGDYMLGTRVVMERGGREERIQETAEREEIRLLREEIEAIAPGMLEQSTEHSDAWYENVQRAIHVTAAAEDVKTTQTAQAKLKQRREQLAAVTPTLEMPSLEDVPAFVAKTVQQIAPQDSKLLVNKPPPKKLM